MENTKRPFTERIAGEQTKSGFMIEKEFLIFNKPVVSTTLNTWRPPIDVYETDDNIMVKMDISGVKTDDINITFKDNVLAICGKRLGNPIHCKTCFYQVEIRYGFFEREIVVPKPIVENNVQAKYSDGYLIIVLPKADQSTTASRFTV